MEKNIIILIVGIIVLIFWWRFGRERIGPVFINPLLKKYSTVAPEIRILWTLRTSIFITIILIWIDPHLPLTKSIPEEHKNSIIITLDISNSMKTDDISPNRLAKAKEVMESFVSKNTSDNIGYVIFAGRTFVLAPPTYDHDAIRELIKETTTDTIDQYQEGTSGTNIGDAILASISSLESIPSEKKSIILVTDGRANIGISPLIALEEAKKRNIEIYSVGIGTASGSNLSYTDSRGVKQYFYDTNGNKIVADIDEATLKTIAEKTGGRYYHAENTGLLEKAFEDIGSIIGTPIVYEKITDSTSLNGGLSLILLLFV
jgi:Ca-activated chloride channel homolog